MYLSLCTMYCTFFFMKDASPGLQWTKNRQVCWAKPSRKIGGLDILIFGRLSNITAKTKSKWCLQISGMFMSWFLKIIPIKIG